MVKVKVYKINGSKQSNRQRGTTSLPPIGNSFMYMETCSDNHVKIYSIVGRDQILFKLLIKLPISIDFQF